MSHEQQHAVDPAEAQLDPLALLKHRLAKQQAALHNLLNVTQMQVAAVMADISYCVTVIEAIESHLPSHNAAAAQAAPAVPSASAPTVAAVAEVQQPTPAALPVKRLSPIEAAAAGAQAGLEAIKNHNAGVHPAGAVSASGAHRRPTVEGQAAPVAPAVPQGAAPQEEKNYLGHFYGTGSVYAKFLSPEVFTLGRGFVKPEYGGVKQYTQDVTELSPRDLHVNQWPCGFYRAADSRLVQFFARDSKAQVILTNLPGDAGPIYVSFAPFTERVAIETLSQDQLAVVWSVVHAACLAFVRAAGDAAA